ncbi:SapB/AmfS family lanthipeptide [Actinomadura rudentiformis]|uniref:SapB/AmfS family lantipeptide n=1 Tax=Actinomadura rudentiformis TaxID=359158 RepID=A0A6H9YH95_9ACTN|nr:SapB/AmfS family lanthipeptide [Actinomadura rudentiformis]KAB2339833.1 SapB/AmfS family lantipeptide [Actinomadura rudentiformis]
MALLDLQGLQAPATSDVASGGSTLTLLTCHSGKPSNLSAALCH